MILGAVLVTASFTQTAQFTAPTSTTNNQLGSAVAVSSDTIFIGAPYVDASEESRDTGTVFVFVKPSGGWADSSGPTAVLTASDAAAEDHFGLTIAVDGDTLVIGAPNLGPLNTGAVYVFVKPDDGWATATETAKFALSDGIEGDNFGSSVAVNGANIVVGARYADAGTELNPDQSPVQTNAGIAYVFTKPDSGWASTTTPTAELTPSTRTMNGFFGTSVAIDSDTIVIGAQSASETTGAVYVFSEPDDGWADATENAILTAPETSNSRFFGVSVAVSGGTIAVGASGGKGAVHMFTRAQEDAAFAPAGRLTIADAVNLGASVALSGEGLVAGAPGGKRNTGSAHTFIKPDEGWIAATPTLLTDSDLYDDDKFGTAVALWGGTAVVGAPQFWVDGSVRLAGTAFVFSDLNVPDPPAPPVSTPTPAPTNTPTPAPTATATPTPTATATPTPTATPAPTPTNTPTPNPTDTPTPTPTATATPTPTATATPTPTDTPTPTPTNTPTPAPTNTPTPTPTATATPTPTNTPTPTPTATATPTPTATATPTPTNTPTPTPTATATPTPTATATPTPTATATPTPNPTNTPTPTPTANPYAYPDRHCYAHPNGYRHAYPDSHRYAYPNSYRRAYPDSHRYAYPNGYRHAYPDSHRYAYPHGNTDADPHSNTDAYPHGNTDAYPHGNTDADHYRHSHSDCYRYAHSYPHSNTDAYLHSNTDAYPHGNTDAYLHGNTDAHPHGNTDAYLHGNTDAHPRSYAHSYPHGNTDAHSHADPYAYRSTYAWTAYANSDRYADAAETDANSDACLHAHAYTDAR